MIIKALVLNEPYASKVESGEKKIETRFGRLFTHRGDLAICCNQGGKSGLVLCVVNIWNGRYMIKEDEVQACIEYHPKRACLFMRNWRYPSAPVRYRERFYYGTYQGIFEIEWSEDVELIPQPDITSAIDYTSNNTLFNFR